MIVTDLRSSDMLVAAGLKTLTGNLLTDSSPDGSFGPDGPGYIKSITVNGTVYTYDPAGGGSMAVAGADHGAFDTANNTITVTTALGGKLTVDMDNGKYRYRRGRRTTASSPRRSGSPSSPRPG